ncbi:hypothetical protein EAH79_16620 [Sphingomonas koreensis]|nr:hypothetical protein EAH79_16620 [Sphingomonas koreensis]
MSRTRFDTACRVRIEHSDEFLCAHVELPYGVAIGPGDRVRVHGDPIHVNFGERCVIDRTATVERAGPVTRAWTKFAGHFAMAELYEVSFSDRRL